MGESGIDGTEIVLHITKGSPSDSLTSYTGHSLGVKILPLCRAAVSVFYSPNRLGQIEIERDYGRREREEEENKQ